MPRRVARSLLALSLLGAFLASASSEEGTTGEAEARWRSGREALEAGRLDHARHFLLEALALQPTNMEIVGDLLRAEGGDAEAVALWLEHAARAGADGAGRFKPPRTWPKTPREDVAAAQALLDARVAALKAVRRALAKCKAGRHLSVLRHLAALARSLSRDAPALAAAAEASIAAARERCAPESDKVIGALHKVMHKALGAKRWVVALEAARILRGLQQQAGQSKGSAAAPSKGLPAILSAERAARKNLQAEGETVHSLETLRAVPESERDAWSREHATWARPGVSASPANLYRIETVCGIETLLVVTEDIEYHHKRLVDWYGSDPFVGRRGLIRLCRSQTDMESSGQPFWWAGGFQSGDVTTVRVNYTSRHGLAGVLTHELTHRFDGAVFPGMPSWLLEGRAVHTAICSVDPHAPSLDERRVGFGQFWKANAAGYGRQDNIEKLLRGTIDDYRDNYDAGYALWVCLSRFQSFDPARQGEPIFAPRLRAYLESFRKSPRADPVERFASFFLDGKAGRPADMKAFAALFARVLRDGATIDPPPWRRVWMKASGDARKEAKRTPHVPIDDRATWPRDRNRADPVEHGEQHAWSAGLLLEAEGEPARAADAFEWALHVDEPVAARCAHAAARSKAQGDAAAAWVQAAEAHRLDPRAWPAVTGPALGVLADTDRRVRALGAELEEREGEARAAQRPRVARARRAARSRLGRFLGLPPLDPVDPPAAPAKEPPPPPDCTPYAGELTAGVADARWSPLDSRANRNWHRPTAASIELGRRKSGKALTGTVRDAGVRRVFARANRWHAGTYTFRSRVRFLSAHVDAKLVVGYTRRDRGVEITLSGGDLAYATGRREEAVALEGIRVRLNDLRPFDGAASLLSRRVTFRSPREVFTVAVHVDGPYVRVQVDGEDALVHRRSTADPVEGYVGFGLYSGLVRFEDPETRAHRVLGPDHVCPCEAQDEPIRLTSPLSFPWGTCVGRRVEGIPVSDRGTFLIWYGESTLPEERKAQYVRDYVKRVREPFEQAQLPVPFRLLLPPAAASGEDFDREADYGLPEGHVHAHAGSPNLTRYLEERVEAVAQRMHTGRRQVPLDEARETERERLFGSPVWLMLDEYGVVRACGTAGSLQQALSLAHHLAGW